MSQNVNFAAFKEPRAFIKILEIGIAIFAFSTTAGYYSEFRVNSKLGPPQKCIDNTTNTATIYKVLGKFQYPFDENELYTSYAIDNKNCTTIVYQERSSLTIAAKHKSESQFFVFTGVLSFLYCVFACLYYIVFENPAESMYSTDVGRCSFVVLDFLVSVLIALFWFAGSIAWAAGLPGLKDDSDPATYIANSPLCSGTLTCNINKEPNYATLKVSIILGFLNLFVWLGNLWFLFKETPWHNPRRDEFQNESVQR